MERKDKTVRVSGQATILWTVDLPVERAREGVTTDDPAVNAVIDFLPQSGSVWTWGQDAEPAEVFFEISDADVEVYDDDRTPLCYWPGCKAESECELNEADGATAGHFCKEHGQLMLARQIAR